MNSNLDSLCVIPPEVSIDKVKEVALFQFGFTGSVSELGGERDRNFLIKHSKDDLRGKDFLLKFANASENDQLLDMQCAALKHIQQINPTIPVPRLIPTKEGKQWASVQLNASESVRVRAFTFLPGISIDDVLKDSGLMKNLGRMVASLDFSLRGFFHPSAKHSLAWDIQHLDQLEELVKYLPKAEEKELVEKTLKTFKENIKPQLGNLRSQIIHNDISYHNTVVEPGNSSIIAGIFDFGDMVYGPMIQNLAIPAAEVPVDCVDPLARSAEIVAGYHEVIPLEDEEFKILPGLIAARLAMQLLLESWAEAEISWTDDREFMSGWREKSTCLLKTILELGPRELENLFRTSCGKVPIVQNSQSTNQPSTNIKQAMQRRNRFLGNANYIEYDRHLHVIHGEGVWLWDAQGNQLLDAYNNVPHAGHCHPRIVSAIAKQTATLNSNTRYHYDVAMDYAEKITSTLPEALEVCYFVSSGSEANDLAWRLATSYTGNRGGLILENAYHGITEATYALTPAEMKNKSTTFQHIAEITAPDDYRGPWKRNNPESGRRYAEYAKEAIARLESTGQRPAAFFMDMIMSSSGIFSPAPGYLENIYAIVRAAGGLCVADEVQSGFGRTGKNMWGFQSGNVIPDIVTFGKPIAGGYPMGLVVTTREIATKFAQSCDFFSTTGGNPVACAAALAMLQVIEDEQLMENADKTGELLMAGIRELATRYPLIGDVRGSGLFIGVELVKDRQTLEPATDEASEIVNHCRDNNVLIGADGILGNVLKIRPPMVFNNSHTRILLKALEKAIQHVIG